MRDRVDEWLAIVEGCGWRVAARRRRSPRLPEDVVSRHQPFPVDVAAFLGRCTTCRTPDDTVWLLCEPEFLVVDPDRFRWNEWEILSLESASRFGREEEEKVTTFWDRHLPVLMSVRSGYSYAAVDTHTGRVVTGAEPDFEDCVAVCDSFGELFQLLKLAHDGDRAAADALALIL